MWRIGRRADVELIPYADSAAQALDLWRIAGRKALGHDGQRLWLHGEYGRELVALMLSPGLQDGAPFAYALPAGADPECYRFTLEAALMLLQLGGTATPATLRRPPRTAVMHMRTLQALDGAEGMEGLLTAFQSWAERSIGDEAWTALEVEFATNARRDPQIRHELAVRDKAIRDTIAGLLTGYAEQFGITLPMSADDAATALLSLGIGLGVQRAIDPSIPVNVLPDVIRLFAGGTARE